MPGHFVPQVRMMKTGNENTELARKFGLPFVVLHNPRPFDTATLNYNWQIWEADAFSIYTTSTEKIDKTSARLGVNAVLTFLGKEGIIIYSGSDGASPKVVDTDMFISIRANQAGFLESLVKKNETAHLYSFITDLTIS